MISYWPSYRSKLSCIGLRLRSNTADPGPITGPIRNHLINKHNITVELQWLAHPCITKTCLYNFDPFKPHFYIVKLGFTGVYIIFLISAQNIDCVYSLEPPRWGGSNEYPQSIFLSGNMKNIKIFYLKSFIFLVVKFSIYLNRHVFVMEIWKFVIDIGSSSQWGLIIAPGQETTGNNLGMYMYFQSSYKIMSCSVYSLESHQWGDSNGAYNIHFH